MSYLRLRQVSKPPATANPKPTTVALIPEAIMPLFVVNIEALPWRSCILLSLTGNSVVAPIEIRIIPVMNTIIPIISVITPTMMTLT